MAYWQGDYGAARLYYEEGLSIWREVGDFRGVADVLHSLAYLAGVTGDYHEAHALHAQSQDMSQRLGDLKAVGYSPVGDAVISHVEGDPAGAQARLEEARALFDEVGEGFGLAGALNLLSRIEAEGGDVETAAEVWRRSFELIRESEDGAASVIALANLSAIQLARGRPRDAVRLAGAAEGLAEALKVRPPTALTRPPDVRAAVADELGEEAAEEAWRDGQAMTLARAMAYADELTRGTQAETA
jgi:tetratricopeptide (TPR) repeat protein